MRGVSHVERLRRRSGVSVTSKLEPEKWLVGLLPMLSYRHVSEQVRSMVMMNVIDSIR